MKDLDSKTDFRLNRIQHPLYCLGPGKRIGIWTQGCSLKCPECLNPDLWNPHNGKSVSIKKLVQQIKNIENYYDGITITGGEPFDQYRPLFEFCRNIKKFTSLNIFIYSGYTISEIENSFPEKEIFSVIDYLIDGRFESKNYADDNMRGSKNQILYRFKNSIPVKSDEIFQGDKWSLNVSDDATVFLAGIPRQGEVSEIELDLQKRGIKLEFR